MSTGTLTTKVQDHRRQDVREELELELSSRVNFLRNRDGFFELHREKCPMRDSQAHCRSLVRRRPGRDGRRHCSRRNSVDAAISLDTNSSSATHPGRSRSGPVATRILEKACARMNPVKQPSRCVGRHVLGL